MLPFQDRTDAGTQLANVLLDHRSRGDLDIDWSNPVVLGLPRGGVPVAYQVAEALDAPLDVIVVRKLGAPYQRELAIGAIGEGPVRVLNDDVIRQAGVRPEQLAAAEAREWPELQGRLERLRAEFPRIPLHGRTAIIVDDGIATGATARAACQVARAQGASHIVLAAPVAAQGCGYQMRDVCDLVVTVDTPREFYAIGACYRHFHAVSEETVVDLLHRAAARRRDSAAPTVSEVVIPAAEVELAGTLTIPARARGAVIFAHGSGSSRHSPRNRFVAEMLSDAGLATLLFDLLTPAEEADRRNVFDVELLGHRLTAATTWLAQQRQAEGLHLGYFGASTGAAAALWAAAQPHSSVAAVVSRGGRPDLAGELLPAVRCPTLLIVGGEDHVVLDLNRQARSQLSCRCDLAVVRGATHLFEEGDTLEHAAELARDWFLEYLPQH